MLRLYRQLSVLLPLVVLFLGCGKSDVPSKAKAEARGEPIRGEPIRSDNVSTKEPAPAAPTNAVPAKSEPVKVAEAPKQNAEKPEYMEASFELLSGFTFEVPDGIVPTNEVGQSEGQIPADVKVLNEKKVSLKGFMLPLKVDNGMVSEMLIMKDQSMCCYGAVPRINDWVSVKMKNGGVKSVMDQPVVMYGKLRVGEMLENGYLVGIYEMDGEKMDESK